MLDVASAMDLVGDVSRKPWIPQPTDPPWVIRSKFVGLSIILMLLLALPMGFGAYLLWSALNAILTGDMTGYMVGGEPAESRLAALPFILFGLFLVGGFGYVLLLALYGYAQALYEFAKALVRPHEAPRGDQR
jgi:ABC-type multidrug transport system fused ATPase/permease subunit